MQSKAKRFLQSDVEALCSIASSIGSYFNDCAIKKMEGGFSRALLMRKTDGSEIVA